MTVALIMESLLTPLSLVGSSIIIVLSWGFVHRKSAQRDLANKRRELQVGYLIDAYRTLEKASNRNAKDSKTTFAEIEKVIADIQLFGTPAQVELVRSFCVEFVQSRTASLDPLLDELRKDLRQELNLGTVPLKTIFFRYTEGPE